MYSSKEARLVLGFSKAQFIKVARYHPEFPAIVLHKPGGSNFYNKTEIDKWMTDRDRAKTISIAHAGWFKAKQGKSVKELELEKRVGQYLELTRGFIMGHFAPTGHVPKKFYWGDSYKRK